MTVPVAFIPDIVPFRRAEGVVERCSESLSGAGAESVVVPGSMFLDCSRLRGCLLVVNALHACLDEARSRGLGTVMFVPPWFEVNDQSGFRRGVEDAFDAVVHSKCACVAMHIPPNMPLPQPLGQYVLLPTECGAPGVMRLATRLYACAELFCFSVPQMVSVDRMLSMLDGCYAKSGQWMKDDMAGMSNYGYIDENSQMVLVDSRPFRDVLGISTVFS